MKLTYLITVKQIVPYHDLHREDMEYDPEGEYEEEAKSEEEALDEFHASIPIACLDNYEITCVALVAAEVERDIKQMQTWGSTVLRRPLGFDGPEESDMADIRNYPNDQQEDDTTTKLLDLAEEMADYLCDSEREDYFDVCMQTETDPYTIDVKKHLWHIFQTRMYFMHLLGRTQLDERWKFVND